jgi:ribosomal-protein-alanine N-acetyltransferase
MVPLFLDDVRQAATFPHRMAPRLETERLVLTIPPSYVARQVVDYFVRNREHLRPWSPTRSEAFFTESFWIARLERDRAEFRRGRSLRLTLFSKLHLARVVGAVQLSQIVRGAFQGGSLGYHLDAEYQGQGLMTEALREVIRYAFDELNLHRVMANYVPENDRSARLLARLGFEKEGLAPDYLRIEGRWRDHVLSSLKNVHWRDEDRRPFELPPVR